MSTAFLALTADQQSVVAERFGRTLIGLIAQAEKADASWLIGRDAGRRAVSISIDQVRQGALQCNQIDTEVTAIAPGDVDAIVRTLVDDCDSVADRIAREEWS